MIFKIILFLIGFIFLSIAILVWFFPKVLVKLVQLLFNKTMGIETNKNPKNQKKVIIEKKNPKNEHGFSDYEEINDKPTSSKKTE
ncbi:MAG: hypothetical protein JXL97_13290 [Bacteroidales bacterium]|nr:hypothetical protein [Bacteroidales bacterium]